uniref:Uncharacterized protein n=1 Tax=Rhinolophus ferrumequinum TaxID=59479 RepID=A0A671FI10_RHIFE
MFLFPKLALPPPWALVSLSVPQGGWIVRSNRLSRTLASVRCANSGSRVLFLQKAHSFAPISQTLSSSPGFFQTLSATSPLFQAGSGVYLSHGLAQNWVPQWAQAQTLGPKGHCVAERGRSGLAVEEEVTVSGGDHGSLLGRREYAAINSMLDQINSCLDHLEEKNDHLHARLQELLESNRQTRLEFQQQLGEAPSDASP